MDPLALKVAARFRTGFKYEPKEKKQSKVDRIMRVLREQTGLSRGVSEDIADAIVRNREVARLAIQKNWPIEDGLIVGPQGALAWTELQASL